MPSDRELERLLKQLRKSLLFSATEASPRFKAKAEARLKLDLARIDDALLDFDTGPENSREEVSPWGRSPQRDCIPARLAAASH